MGPPLVTVCEWLTGLKLLLTFSTLPALIFIPVLCAISSPTYYMSLYTYKNCVQTSSSTYNNHKCNMFTSPHLHIHLPIVVVAVNIRNFFAPPCMSSAYVKLN